MQRLPTSGFALGLIATLTGVVLAAGARPAAGAASFQGVGNLPGRPDSRGGLWGVSADGHVGVGGSSTSPGFVAPFYWTRETGPISLHSGGVPEGDSSQATQASADGSVIVGQDSNRAFRWTRDGGMQYLIPSSGPFDYSEAWGVSDDGSVVVGMRNTEAATTEAFRWTTAGGYTRLSELPGYAYAVSGDGKVAAGWVYDAGKTLAVRWTDRGMERLGDLSGGNGGSNVMALSSDGSIAVGVSAAPRADEVAFLWREGVGMRSLKSLSAGPAFPGQPYDMSADGSVVVGTADFGSGYVAFVWDAAHGMRPLNDILTSDYGLDLSGWTLRTAFGVSADGRTIVGEGLNPAGLPEGFYAVVPEPGAGAAAICLLAGVTLRRRRRL